MKGICYIVGAGECCGGPDIKDGDMLIAADGGYEKIIEWGLLPDVLIGDFDSLCSLPKKIKTLQYPIEKDETDMFLAYKYGEKSGYKRFEIYGGAGGREDHTFANYSLLLYAKNAGNDIILHGNKAKIYVIKNEKIIINGARGKTVSVFAIGKDAEGVGIKGLKYEADNIKLTCDFPLGVSNSFTDNEAEISVLDGTLLIMEEC